MFKIGNFSKICQVSIKTLRYWDSVDLLKPAHTDASSGYRYYTVAQVEQVNRIIAFKGMGLSINQIRKLLEEDIPASEMRGMFRLKKAEIEQQIEQAQIQLAMVESRLQQIEAGDALPDYEAVLKSVPPQEALTLRRISPNFDDLVQCIYQAHNAREKSNAGPLHAIFWDEAFDNTNVEVELSLPFEKHPPPELKLNDDLTMQHDELPGVELMASTVHRGPWISLNMGYTALGRWIHTNDYHIIGVGREVFHHIGQGVNHTETVTEIQFPVQKIGA